MSIFWSALVKNCFFFLFSGFSFKVFVHLLNISFLKILLWAFLTEHFLSLDNPIYSNCIIYHLYANNTKPLSPTYTIPMHYKYVLVYAKACLTLRNWYSTDMSIISDILVFSMMKYYSKIYTYIILFNFHNYSMGLLLLLCINSGFSMNWLTQLWRRQNQHLQSGPELLQFKFTMCGLLQNSLSLQGSLFFFP